MLQKTQKALHKFYELHDSDFNATRLDFKPYTNRVTGEEQTHYGPFNSMVEIYQMMSGLHLQLQEDIFRCDYSEAYSHPMECIVKIEDVSNYIDEHINQIEQLASNYEGKDPLREDVLPFPIHLTLENFKKTKGVLDYVLNNEEIKQAKALYLPTVNENKAKGDEYVSSNLIEKLRATNHPDFDVKKLVQLLIELNSNWQQSNFYTVGLLVRTIINHVPPLFGDFSSFNEVVAEYGNNIFKRSMKHLNTSLRNIADGYTHDLIRKREMLPNEQQIRFQAELDILLLEVLKRLV